jgi:hypothetical protein
MKWARRNSVAPVAQGFDECREPIAQPAIKLRRFFELLSTPAGHSHKAAGKFRKAGHVALELFKLRHRQDIFLTFSPAFFDVPQRDIGGHASGQRSHGGHLFLTARLLTYTQLIPLVPSAPQRSIMERRFLEPRLEFVFGKSQA